jgi:Calx-beta domain
VSVEYATADGRATAAGGDYRPDSGRLTFLPGETRQTVTVQVNGDLLGEEDEGFFVRLSNAQGQDAVIADGEGKATVLDDEPRIFLLTPVVLGEGGRVGTRPFVVLAFLSAPSSVPVTVRYTTAEGTATAGSDYVAADREVTFNPGETFKFIPFALARDTVPEPFEHFFVDLAPVTGNVVVLRPGVVYITDDDTSQASSGGSGGALAAPVTGNGTGGGAVGIRGDGAIRPTSTGTIWLDANAADWSWFVDPTHWKDPEFTAPSNPGEMNRMDLLTVLEHEVGHLLGCDHEDGVMQDTLAAGTRLTPSAGSDADWLLAIDGLFAEAWSKKRK